MRTRPLVLGLLSSSVYRAASSSASSRGSGAAALRVRVSGESGSESVRVARSIASGLRDLYGEGALEVEFVEGRGSGGETPSQDGSVEPEGGRNEGGTIRAEWGPAPHQARTMRDIGEFRDFMKNHFVSRRPLGCIPPSPPAHAFPDGRSSSSGSSSNMKKWSIQGEDPEAVKADYDLVVIGGGSGGLACAKEAARLGAKVACFDYVRPSPQGSVWGLGGTCVNVGCIPKKLMHQAALLGSFEKDMPSYGWSIGGTARSHNWSELVASVTNYIRSLNFKHNSDLWGLEIDYYNMLGSLASSGLGKGRRGSSPEAIRVIGTSDSATEGEERKELTARAVVIAVGGRPRPLECEGGELAISSDDLFSLSRPPGRTLVVGASYVALECAGFLTGLGYEVSVLARSILLRGFDRDCAEMVGKYMEQEGTRIIRGAVPISIRRFSAEEKKGEKESGGGGKLEVTWADPDSGELIAEVFDTVIAATGRRPETSSLRLEGAGVEIDAESRKIIALAEQTSNPRVFALGDCVEGMPELTPQAIASGVRLARRLYRSRVKGGAEAVATEDEHLCRPPDASLTPTAIFTPLEYGCCGVTEEQALDRLGEDNIEVYHASFIPLEWKPNEERAFGSPCYVKAICQRGGDQTVLGLHIVGPNAGEIMQGFAAAMRLGLTYPDLRAVVGIHPTVAEEAVKVQVTKRSGEPHDAGNC